MSLLKVVALSRMDLAICVMVCLGGFTVHTMPAVAQEARHLL